MAVIFVVLLFTFVGRTSVVSGKSMIQTLQNGEMLLISRLGGSFEQGDIVISCGELVRVAKFDDVLRQESSIDYTTYTQVVNYTFIGEQTLISGIMGVTDLNPIKVAVITKNNGNAFISTLSIPKETKLADDEITLEF